jgi:hypothetical protein
MSLSPEEQEDRELQPLVYDHIVRDRIDLSHSVLARVEQRHGLQDDRSCVGVTR